MLRFLQCMTHQTLKNGFSFNIVTVFPKKYRCSIHLKVSPHSRPTSCLCLSFSSSSATLNTALYASCFSCNNRSSSVVFKNKHYCKAQQKPWVHKFIYYFSWSFVKYWSTKNCRSIQVHTVYCILIFVWWIIYEKTSKFSFNSMQIFG